MAADPHDDEWALLRRFLCRGDPVSQPRPRVYGNNTVGDTPRSRAWKDHVARCAAAQSAHTEGIVRVDLLFMLPRPTRLCRASDPPGPVRHGVRPDVDNLAKAVLDALHPIVGNDASVCDLRVSKYYASINGLTGCLISVYRLKGASDA